VRFTNNLFFCVRLGIW